MFFAEQTEEYFDSSTHTWHYKMDNLTSPFQSVLHCYWWCIISMSSTGYGDVVPRSPVGKLVAGCTIVLGLLVFTFPVAVVGSHFIHEWIHHKKRGASRYRESESHGSINSTLLVPSDNEGDDVRGSNSSEVVLAQLASLERSIVKLRESLESQPRRRGL